MERLNDIMGRTTPRRQQLPEQRSSQGQRQRQQAQQPTESLPEQMARLGQQQAYSSRQQHQYPPAARTRSPQGQGNPGAPVAREGRQYGAPNTRPARQSYTTQHPAVDAGEAYQPRSRPQREVARSRPVPPSPPVDDYYHTDDYAPSLPADVADEWDEDEEGAGNMRYGDWEEDSNEVLVYQRGDIQIVPEARASYPQVTREIPAAESGSRAHITRNLRDLPMPAPTQAMLPQSAQVRARTQEVQHYQRHTQPLDPRTMVGVNRELSQKPQPRQTRQIVPQTQRLPVPASIPAPPSSSARSACPRCKGAGYLRIDVPFGHPNFGKPVACECKEAEKKEKRRQQLLDISDLWAFRSKGFNNFNTRFPGMHPTVQEAFNAAYSFAQDPDGWLLLVGPNGCGKTHLAAAIANQTLDEGSVVLFAVVPDLLAHLRATFAPTSTEVYDQLFAKMREAELLVLDDLGAHQSSPWASEKLFQLLNYRYNARYPTVITANKPGLSSIDERIQSRLGDIGLVTTVVLNGAQDYRRHNPRRE